MEFKGRKQKGIGAYVAIPKKRDIRFFINKNNPLFERNGLLIYDDVLPKELVDQGGILNAGDFVIYNSFNRLDNKSYYIFMYKNSILMVFTGSKLGATKNIRKTLFLIACEFQNEFKLLEFTK